MISNNGEAHERLNSDVVGVKPKTSSVAVHFYGISALVLLVSLFGMQIAGIQIGLNTAHKVVQDQRLQFLMDVVSFVLDQLTVNGTNATGSNSASAAAENLVTAVNMFKAESLATLSMAAAPQASFVMTNGQPGFNVGMPFQAIPLALAALFTVDLQAMVGRMVVLTKEAMALDWSIPQSGCVEMPAAYPSGTHPTAGGACSTDSDCQVNGDNDATCPSTKICKCVQQGSYDICNQNVQKAGVDTPCSPVGYFPPDIGHGVMGYVFPDGKAYCGAVDPGDRCYPYSSPQLSSVMPTGKYYKCDVCGFAVDKQQQDQMKKQIIGVANYIEQYIHLLPNPPPQGIPSPLTDWLTPFLKANLTAVASVVEGITDTWLNIPFPTDISQPPYVNLNILRPLVKTINVAAAMIRQQGPW